MMNDKNKIIDLYNDMVVIHSNLRVIRENIDYLLECLGYNFTIDDNPVNNSVINSCKSDIISLRNDMNNDMLERLKQYF